MPRYSDELKDSILVRILNDENINIQELSRETEIHENTLRKWRSSAKRSGISPSSNNKSSEKWSTQDKFIIVLETAPLNELELSEYCRKKDFILNKLRLGKMITFKQMVA